MEKNVVAVQQTKRTSVVLNALRVTMRNLQEVPDSPETAKLWRLAMEYEREAQQWPETSPSNYQREAMMKLVLALHIEVAKLARANTPPSR
jgi:hypothetical protein